MNQNTHGNDSIRGYVLINFMESYIQSVINKMKKKQPILNMEVYLCGIPHMTIIVNE